MKQEQVCSVGRTVCEADLCCRRMAHLVVLLLVAAVLSGLMGQMAEPSGSIVFDPCSHYPGNVQSWLLLLLFPGYLSSRQYAVCIPTYRDIYRDIYR